MKKIKIDIFKKKCCFCSEKILNNEIVCDKCNEKIKAYSMERKCALCNRKLTTEGVICKYCEKLSPCFDQAIALYSYKDDFQASFLKMKFHKNYSKVIPFSHLMTKQFEKMNVQCDFAVCVPTTLKNYVVRDYCSSCELLYKISKKLSLKAYDDMLIKKKPVQQSASLKFEDRYTNVVGMYAFNKRYKNIIKDKTVLVVDDVITSGATLSECAKVLKENGADRVYAVSLLYGGDTF